MEEIEEIEDVEDADGDVDEEEFMDED